MIKDFKALVFDFNGTLLWDTPHHNSAWDKFLINHKIQLSDLEKETKIHGKTNKDIFELLFERSINSQELEMYSEEKESLYRKFVIDSKIELAKGAIDLFHFCKENSIEIAIATSSYKQNTEFFISHFKLLQWFKKENVFYNDGTMKSKPDPAIFELAINKLGHGRDQIAIFEDSHAGIAAAEAAGVGRVFIIDSTQSHLSHKKHTVLSSFEQVL